VIADARRIRKRYRETYGTETVFAPYGANTRRDEGTEALDKWGLTPREYLLFVGRLVPENAPLELIEAFRGVETDKKLVVVGDASYMDEYRKKIHDAADGNVVLTGYAFGKDYAQLSSHAYAYVQPSGVEGTRPAVLDQLGFGNCVLVRDTSVNLEVIADCGFSFDRTDIPGDLTAMLRRLVEDPEKVAAMRHRALTRVTGFYNWEWITDFYVELFRALIRGSARPQYDEYVESNGH
jgi:glycosyltransferase involved in cell wall biosynthesis